MYAESVCESTRMHMVCAFMRVVAFFDLVFVVAPGIHLFIIKFCLLWREVKAMMKSQKVPWRKEVHSWRIIQEQYFSRIFGQDF